MRSSRHTATVPGQGGGGREVADRDAAAHRLGQAVGGPGHDRAGGRGGQVHHLRVAGPGQQAVHDPGGAPGRFRCEFGFDGPHLPRVGAGVGAGPVDFGVGEVRGADPRREGGADAPFGPPPGLPVGVGGGCLQPQPGGEDGADVGEPAQGRRPGRVGQAACGHAGRGEPAPRGAGALGAGGGVAGVPPPGGDAAQPGGLHLQRGGQQVIRNCVMFCAQQQAGHVAAGDADGAGVGAARRVPCRVLLLLLLLPRGPPLPVGCGSSWHGRPAIRAGIRLPSHYGT